MVMVAQLFIRLMTMLRYNNMKFKLMYSMLLFFIFTINNTYVHGTTMIMFGSGSFYFGFYKILWDRRFARGYEVNETILIDDPMALTLICNGLIPAPNEETWYKKVEVIDSNYYVTCEMNYSGIFKELARTFFPPYYHYNEISNDAYFTLNYSCMHDRWEGINVTVKIYHPENIKKLPSQIKIKCLIPNYDPGENNNYKTKLKKLNKIYIK